MAKIAFAGAFACRLAEPVRARLGGSHEIVCNDEAGIVAHLAEADVLVTLGFAHDMAQAARKLKLVQVPGAGLDRIDRAVLPAGTQLANAYGHETGIAEYVIGAMLYLARDFGRIDAKLRQGTWESQWAVGTPAPALWHELAGKTLGILGYGRIGQAVARRARAFDMNVRAIRRQAGSSSDSNAVSIAGPDGLDNLLRRADYLAITVALTEQTRRMIGARELGLMKASAVLVNVARGDVVDPKALYDALAKKTLAGAAIDVWYRYPTGSGPTFPSEHPFHDLPNVLMTPHVSGWTEGMLQARTEVIAENVARLESGRPLLNLVQ